MKQFSRNSSKEASNPQVSRIGLCCFWQVWIQWSWNCRSEHSPGFRSRETQQRVCSQRQRAPSTRTERSSKTSPRSRREIQPDNRRLDERSWRHEEKMTKRDESIKKKKRVTIKYFLILSFKKCAISSFFVEHFLLLFVFCFTKKYFFLKQKNKKKSQCFPTKYIRTFISN